MSTSPRPRPPRLAVFKFSSCDGCQLSLLDLEDELLALTSQVEIRYFLEASSAAHDGPYDLALVEGSIATEHDIQRVQDIRSQTRHLVAIGACATAGGIQALRNFGDLGEIAGAVYPRPRQLKVLASSTPLSEHVDVDFELPGCPVDRHQLLEVVVAFLHQRRPLVPSHSVCVDCKLRGNECVVVARGIPCLGPVTRSGCGAICPAYDRGCYGCFGPAETVNTDSLVDRWRQLGDTREDVHRRFRGINAWAAPMREAAERHG